MDKQINRVKNRYIYILFIYYLFIYNIYTRSCSCGKSLPLEQEGDLCERKVAHRPLARPFLCLYSTIRQPQVGRKFPASNTKCIYDFIFVKPVKKKLVIWQLALHLDKNKIWSVPTSYANINNRWTEVLNVKYQDFKNIGRKYCCVYF